MGSQHFKSPLVNYKHFIIHSGYREAGTLSAKPYWKCRKFERKPYMYPEAPSLPKDRVDKDFAFKNIAIGKEKATHKHGYR